MRSIAKNGWCICCCVMLVFLFAFCLVSCQNEVAWEELDLTGTDKNGIGNADLEDISSQLFDESTGDGETSDFETESYPIENSTPDLPELRVKTPIFSQQGGLYEYNLSVTLTCSDEYTIHYTTNGSIPTVSSALYKDAIAVLSDKVKSTSIRAACFDKAGNIVGDVVTHTYVRTSPNSNIHTVFITADKSDLDYLYVNYKDSYEKPAHVEIITPSGEMVISQDVGLRIFGGSSRGHSRGRRPD